MTILAAHEPITTQATWEGCTQQALGSECPMRARATVFVPVEAGGLDRRRQCGMHAVISAQADAATVVWDDPHDEPVAVSVAALHHAGIDVAACDSSRARLSVEERIAQTEKALVERLPGLGFAPNGPYADRSRSWTRGSLWVCLDREDWVCGEYTVLPEGRIWVQLDHQDPVLEITADLPDVTERVLAAVAAMTPLRQYQDTLAAVVAHTGECPVCPELRAYGEPDGCSTYEGLLRVLADVRTEFEATLPSGGTR